MGEVRRTHVRDTSYTRLNLTYADNVLLLSTFSFCAVDTACSIFAVKREATYVRRILGVTMILPLPAN